MAQQIKNVESVTDWTNFLIGLLDKGEWKTLLMTLAVTFAITYILKIVYSSTINERLRKANHIRLMAILAGMIAAFMMWPNGAVSMPWYAAALLMGPFSIAVHHALIGISKNAPVKNIAPWLYPALKGRKDRRDYMTRKKR